MSIEKATYMEIMLEDDRREESKNVDDVKKFIRILDMSYSLSHDSKKRNICSDLTIIRSIDKNSPYLFDMIHDDQKKYIRIYNIENDLIKFISYFGNSFFKIINRDYNINSQIESLIISFSHLGMKYIQDGIESSYYSSDFYNNIT